MPVKKGTLVAPDYDRKTAIQGKRILNRNSARKDWPKDDWCVLYIRPISKKLKNRFKKVVKARGENIKFVIQAMMLMYVKQAKKVRGTKVCVKKSKGEKIDFRDPDTRKELNAFYRRLNMRFDPPPNNTEKQKANLKYRKVSK